MNADARIAFLIRRCFICTHLLIIDSDDNTLPSTERLFCTKLKPTERVPITTLSIQNIASCKMNDLFASRFLSLH